MTIPVLKRIKVSTEEDLRTWLGKHSGYPRDVMIVTCSKTSRNSYLGSAQVRDIVRRSGWTAGRSYTLDGDLMGHVASNMQGTKR